MQQNVSMVFRAISGVLAATLFAGCATQEMDFGSAPLGAIVHVGDQQGQTPCTLKIPKGATHARFTLPTGEEMTLPLPELDSSFDDAGEGHQLFVAKSLKVVGGTAAVIGAGAVILCMLPYIFGGDSSVYDDDADGSFTYDEGEDYLNVLFGGVLFFAAGAVVFATGDWIEPDEPNPFLKADFGWPEEELYEDKGYGAKRMKNLAH